MNINDVIQRVYEKRRKVIMNSLCYKEPDLNIYMGEDIYLELKSGIAGEQCQAAIEFYTDDTILGHPVYRIINDGAHFKVVEV